MGRRSRVLLVLLVAAAAASVAPASSGDANVEAQVMAKIRASRGGLIQHSGLLSVARAHSMQMSREGRMSHANADSRIRNAPPDPMETNGAPDDGQPPAAWCENVTYSTGHPASEVPGRLYSQWANSGAHARCMRDTSRNVGAVGVYYDGTTWWATFIATVDNTPPGGGGAPPRATSAPRPAPADRPASEPAAAPTRSEPSGDVRAPARGSGDAPTTAGSPSSVGTRADAEHPRSRSDDRSEADADDPTSGRTRGRTAGTSGGSIIVQTGELPSEDGDSVPFAPVNELSAALGYSWPEYSALAAVLVIALLMLTRRLRQHDDVSVPAPVERELAGVSAG